MTVDTAALRRSLHAANRREHLAVGTTWHWAPAAIDTLLEEVDRLQQEVEHWQETAYEESMGEDL